MLHHFAPLLPRRAAARGGNDCTLLAGFARFLIWASRNAHPQGRRPCS